MARNGLKQKHETVTRELQYKFQHNINLSPLDICLKQSIISKDMHKCANFFIYLYYVRYGNQRLISHYGYSIKTRLSVKDPITEEKQNNLYKSLSNILIKEQTYNIIRDVCIFSRSPAFLNVANLQVNTKNIITKEYELFIQGMETVSKFLSTTRI